MIFSPETDPSSRVTLKLTANDRDFRQLILANIQDSALQFWHHFSGLSNWSEGYAILLMSEICLYRSKPSISGGALTLLTHSLILDIDNIVVVRAARPF